MICGPRAHSGGPQPSLRVRAGAHPRSSSASLVANPRSQPMLATRPLAARKRGRGSIAPHAVAHTRRRTKAGVSDRPSRRPAGRRRGGLAAGEKHVAAEGRASHLPSCSCGYSSRPAPARLLVSDTGSARRDRPGPRLQPAGVSGEHWMRPAGTAGGGDTSSPCALSGRRRRVPGTGLVAAASRRRVRTAASDCASGVGPVPTRSSFCVSSGTRRCPRRSGAGSVLGVSGLLFAIGDQPQRVQSFAWFRRCVAGDFAWPPGSLADQCGECRYQQRGDDE